MKKSIKITLIILSILAILTLISIVCGLVYILSLNSKLEFDRNKLEVANIRLDIYDNNNKIINENDSKSIRLSELNDYTVSAFLSIEDKEFYNHNGLNYKRIMGAFVNNIKTKSLSQGASTISQQLIKNTHLTNEKTFSRKIKEMILTMKMENSMTKDEILETYLNVIYFGESAFGIEQASNVFFNKSAKELNISESATLAGIIKSPLYYSPIYNYENAISRRDLVLKEMKEDYLITEEEYDSAISSKINLSLNSKAKSNYNNLYIKQTYDEAIKILKISEKEIGMNGIKIYTYQDEDRQKYLEELIMNDNYYVENKYGNIADGLSVIIDNKTGGIIAYAGRSEYDLVNIKRQPGSAIKPPLVYAPALEYGYISPITPILDEKIDIDGYSPNNLGNKLHGYVSASECVAQSLNIPAVKLMNYVGIDKCKEFASKSNIYFSDSDNGYAIALGGFTDGIKLIDLANSYMPYSNNGEIKDAKFIKKIVSKSGKVLYQNKETSRIVMGSDTAYLMHSMLIDGVKTGTSRALKNLPFEVAGKTGTVCIKDRNDNTDAISVAYTSNHTMATWFGNTTLKEEYILPSSNNGGTFATYIIRDMFKEMYKDNSPKELCMPDTVEEVYIDINELNDNHIVELAVDTCPDRYKLKTIVSKRYMPNVSIDNYKDFDITNYTVNLRNDVVNISFDAKDYIEYKIIKISNNKESILDVITNKNGTINYQDKDIESNQIYNYKIYATNNILHSTRQTEEIAIITPKFKEEHIEKLNIKNSTIDSSNNNWLYMVNT